MLIVVFQNSNINRIFYWCPQIHYGGSDMTDDLLYLIENWHVFTAYIWEKLEWRLGE